MKEKKDGWSITDWMNQPTTTLDKSTKSTVGDNINYTSLRPDVSIKEYCHHAAIAYARMGWKVFPVWGATPGKDGKRICRCPLGEYCENPAKHPQGKLVPRGFTDATDDLATIDAWFAEDPEVGVAVNVRASGLVVLDYDPRNDVFGDGIEALEAVIGERIESDVQQDSQSGGKHWFFAESNGITYPAKVEGFKCFDIKHNGYIILEPTRGLEGDYSFEGSSSPLEGMFPSPAPAWLDSLSTGGNNKIFHTTTGVDFNKGRYLSAETKAHLLSALNKFDHDHRGVLGEVGAMLYECGRTGFDVWVEWAARSDKHNPELCRKIWKTFEGGSKSGKPRAGYETIFYRAQERGWINPMAGAGVVATTPMLEVLQPTTTEIVVANPPQPLEPVAWDGGRLPAVLGDLEDWINATSKTPQPDFAMAASIQIVATAIGRRYKTNYGNTSNLFMMAVAETGTGKEHAKFCIEEALREAGLENHLGSNGYTSESGVISLLLEKPVHITIIDEMGKYLKNAEQTSQNRHGEVNTTLMEAWGRAQGRMAPKSFSTFGLRQNQIDTINRSVWHPHVHLYSMTTPETLLNSLTTAMLADGFLNRFTIIPSAVQRPDRLTLNRNSLPVPQSFVDWVGRVLAVNSLGDAVFDSQMQPAYKEIPIGQAAYAVFDDYYQLVESRRKDRQFEAVKEQFMRSVEQAMRLSLVFAVACEHSEVKPEIAKLAVKWIDHYLMLTIDQIIHNVRDSDFDAICEQVKQYIYRQGVVGATMREIRNHCRKFRAMDDRGRQGIMRGLLMCEDIAVANRIGSNGKAVEVYVGVAHE